MNSTEYWSQRYHEKNTPWDMGTASPPLTAYLQTLNHKSQKILIPGAGNAYEAEWLWLNGFTNTYVADVAPEPLQGLKRRVPAFPDEQLLLGDFFALDQQFDLVVEQTFFCALQPRQREDYMLKMKEIIRPGGSLMGVLFDFPLTEQGPPFGGSLDEYKQLFSKEFKIHKLERCYNSIKARAGNELFIHLIKP